MDPPRCVSSTLLIRHTVPAAGPRMLLSQVPIFSTSSLISCTLRVLLRSFSVIFMLVGCSGTPIGVRLFG